MIPTSTLTLTVIHDEMTNNLKWESWSSLKRVGHVHTNKQNRTNSSRTSPLPRHNIAGGIGTRKTNPATLWVNLLHQHEYTRTPFRITGPPGGAPRHRNRLHPRRE
jgi:hypothetical protein